MVIFFFFMKTEKNYGLSIQVDLDDYLMVNYMLIPQMNIGGSKQSVSELEVDDVVLLAMLVNSECRGCIYEEKRVVAQVVANRVLHNFSGFGTTYREQIFAKGKYYQFSGAQRRGNCGKQFKMNTTIEKELNDYGVFNVKKDKYHYENYRAAYEVIVEGYRDIDCDVMYFSNSKAATNKKEVARQKKNEYKLPFPKNIVAKFGHDTFSKCKKTQC